VTQAIKVPRASKVFKEYKVLKETKEYRAPRVTQAIKDLKGNKESRVSKVLKENLVNKSLHPIPHQLILVCIGLILVLRRDVDDCSRKDIIV
jgi:hypothetical protein